MSLKMFSEARTWKIFAGPGCGKTWQLQHIIDGLIQDGVQYEEIMYVLFNRRPAEAFRKTYIDKGVSEKRLIWWNTHHSICKRLLKLKSSSILDLSRWGQKHGFPLTGTVADSYSWDAVFSSLSTKIFQGDTSTLTFEEQELLNALKKTELEENQFCHVRYLEKALRMNLFPVGVKYIFFDEAQDNGKIQFDWLQHIILLNNNVKGIVLAGDDKQAINGFKGANSSLFLDFPTERVIEIQKTYRLPRTILDEANKIIEPVKHRSLLTTETVKLEPGEVIHTGSLVEALYHVRDLIKKRKGVIILLRNNCFENRVLDVLKDFAIPVAEKWREALWKTIRALNDARLAGGVDETVLSHILPSIPEVEGQLHENAYWEPGVVARIRKGDFFTDPDAMDALTRLRMGDILPLEDLVKLGFSQSFIDDVRNHDIPYDKWNLAPLNMMAFKYSVDQFGSQAKPIRVETIHAVKGEEEDVVVLVNNITGRTEQEERENEDDERRVWFVGATRARETLIITQLDDLRKQSQILCQL